MQSGVATHMSLAAEKADIMLAEDDLNGASRAMAWTSARHDGGRLRLVADRQAFSFSSRGGKRARRSGSFKTGWPAALAKLAQSRR